MEALHYGRIYKTKSAACDVNQDADSTGVKKSSDECTIAEDLVCLAKQAKKELLKEKMKAHMQAKKGDKLDKIAEIAVDAVIACMEHKMAGHEACEEYKNKLKAIFKS